MGAYYEKTNVELSLEYFRKAESQKNEWASLHAGMLMLENKMDHVEAQKHIQQSAIQGN